MIKSIVLANPIVLVGLVILLLFGSKFVLRFWYMFTKPPGSDAAKSADNDGIEVNIPALRKSTIFYANVANELENDMQHMGTNSGPMFAKLSHLNNEELKAVWKEFGIRSNRTFGITTFSGNLGEWFDAELRDIFELNNLKKMKAIWSQTGLW